MTHNDLRYEFGPYQLNPSQRILTRDGEGIALTPKATEILLILVKHPGQLGEKDELLKEVWPDTFVETIAVSEDQSEDFAESDERPVVVVLPFINNTGRRRIGLSGRVKFQTS